MFVCEFEFVCVAVAGDTEEWLELERVSKDVTVVEGGVVCNSKGKKLFCYNRVMQV